MKGPKSFVVIDVDGLRRDVFRAALEAGDLPNVKRIVGGRTQPLADHLAAHPELDYADAANRIRLAASVTTGDLILVANGREGYYFGAPTTGVHGGLYPEESEVVLTFACPGGSPDEIGWLRETVTGVVTDRCANEGGREPSVADMVPVALALLGLSG